MDIDKIIQDLNRRFAAPLPEFYKRRIVVWIDEDAEFADRIREISLDNAKTAVLTGTNNFAVKKLLAVDDPTSNYVLYRPFSYALDEDNWFMDIELYSEIFRADLISMWMDEMGIVQTSVLREECRHYRKFFNAQNRRSRIAVQSVSPATKPELWLSIMAALAGLKDAKPSAIIKSVLKAGLDKEHNSVYADFVNYGIDEAFWRMVSQGTGFERSSNLTDESVVLNELAKHIMMTSLTRTMRREFLSKFDKYISAAHQAYCYDFVSEWMHSEDNKDLYEIAVCVENALELPHWFMKLPLADLVNSEVFPCIHEVILIKIMTEISDHIIDVDTIVRTAEKRRTCVWYDDIKHYYEGILQAAKMQAFIKAHAAGFHTVEPVKIWALYTTDYYKMDTYYREFHRCYDELHKNYHESLTEPFKHVMEKVEGLYVTGFLDPLGDNWTSSAAEELSLYGRVNGVPHQIDFYRRLTAVSDTKVYVIISDALRYETAVSLAEQLQRETKAKVDVNSMQAIFPTITKFGMAALLPNQKISSEVRSGTLTVLVDGQSSDANNRDKILKAKNPNSVALKYHDIIDMKRADRKALIKGMDVVYLYHDTIDTAGHNAKDVFTACDTAVKELKSLVRIITGEWSGVRIVITSDHGFLFTYKPLCEDDKVDRTVESSQVVEVGRRYAIMQKGAAPQYLLPVKFLCGDASYDAFTPRENIRIKMKGGGGNFVHGGISLQEMVVPVIDYHFLRNQSKEYLKNKNKYDTKPVEISLISANRKICNMIFTLIFFQKDPVGGNREAAAYQLYFTDSDGSQISDIQKIIADKTSGNVQERTIRCSFNLKSRKYIHTETYYLVIADENGLQIQREEFQIDIALAVDDFNFFS